MAEAKPIQFVPSTLAETTGRQHYLIMVLKPPNLACTP